jgi:hypothetical protein
MTQHPTNTGASAWREAFRSSSILAADSAMFQSDIIHLAADLSFLHTDHSITLTTQWKIEPVSTF